MLGLFGLKAGVGARLHFGHRALELRFALLAALHFGGNRQAVLQGRRVGLVGLDQQLGDFQIEGVQGFLGVAVAHGGVFARVAKIFVPAMATVIWPTCSTQQHADSSRICLKAWVSSGPFFRRNVQSVS